MRPHEKRLGTFGAVGPVCHLRLCMLPSQCRLRTLKLVVTFFSLQVSFSFQALCKLITEQLFDASLRLFRMGLAHVVQTSIPTWPLVLPVYLNINFNQSCLVSQQACVSLNHYVQVTFGCVFPWFDLPWQSNRQVNANNFKSLLQVLFKLFF